MKTLITCFMLLTFLQSNGQSSNGSKIKNGSVVYLSTENQVNWRADEKHKYYPAEWLYDKIESAVLDTSKKKRSCACGILPRNHFHISNLKDSINSSGIIQLDISIPESPITIYGIFQGMSVTSNMEVTKYDTVRVFITYADTAKDIPAGQYMQFKNCNEVGCSDSSHSNSMVKYHWGTFTSYVADKSIHWSFVYRIRKWCAACVWDETNPVRVIGGDNPHGRWEFYKYISEDGKDLSENWIIISQHRTRDASILIYTTPNAGTLW